MKEQITRTDDKIREQFVIYNKTHDILAKGHIYEQRNVAITERDGVGTSEHYTSLDATLQTFGNVGTIEFI